MIIPRPMDSLPDQVRIIHPTVASTKAATITSRELCPVCLGSALAKPRAVIASESCRARSNPPTNSGITSGNQSPKRFIRWPRNNWASLIW